MLSLPMHPALKNMIITLSSGIVAALLATTVYGATLPLDEPGSEGPKPSDQAVASAAPAKTDDAAAAAALRAMLAGQRPLMGAAPAEQIRR
jgi:hypothetical protein